jgi:anaerobic magnesium-protoporphyrin IX monomethyl ester cyclase
VRDADILHLYKQAGFERFLMGMENTDEATLRLIRKGGGTVKDREAIRLLRRHDILSMATWVVGFEEETDRDLLRGLRQLLSYDPDQIQTLYVTPHRWTPFFRIAAGRQVIQTDQRRWDYKHQVLATRHMPPWRLIAWVKVIEAIVQLRPRALWRYVSHRDAKIRHGIRWYYRMGRRVWFHEIWNFLLRDRRLRDGPSLAAFWGAPQDAEEEALHVRARASIERAPAPTARARRAAT